MSVFREPNPIAFSPEEEVQVKAELELLVRALRNVPGGGKMEEGYWSSIYHKIRGAQDAGWSNLPMRDYAYNGLGVEMKMLSNRNPLQAPGKRIMHPAATRTINFDPTRPADECKVQILSQLGSQIAEFRTRVAQANSARAADIRWGVFLWKRSLDEFLYFEERMIEPDPNEYTAEFIAGTHRGKPTRNLHIFERSTNVKRFSITMPDKGAKVQPYFDVPLIGQGSHAFIIPVDGRKPIWLRQDTIRTIETAAGDEDIDEFLQRLLEH